jgi:hypothetical protein
LAGGGPARNRPRHGSRRGPPNDRQPRTGSRRGRDALRRQRARLVGPVPGRAALRGRGSASA